MDKVLADILRKECVVYLDDILVHGKSFKSALWALRCVLGRVTVAGLKLHPKNVVSWGVRLRSWVKGLGAGVSAP